MREKLSLLSDTNIIPAVARSLGVTRSTLAQWRSHVQGHQVSLVVNAQRDTPALSELLRWAVTSGVVFSPFVEFKWCGESGYGLFVKNDGKIKSLPAGHSVLSMPMYIAVNSQPLSNEFPFHAAVLDVAQQLAQLRTPHAKFLSTLTPLPRNAASMSLSEEDLASLKSDEGRGVLRDLHSYKAFTTLPRWAVTHALSRTHQRSDPHTVSLFPLIDMLNHHNVPISSGATPPCHYRIVSDGGLVVVENSLSGVPDPCLRIPYMHMTTMRDMCPGEECTYTYGAFDGDDPADQDLVRLYGGFEVCPGKCRDPNDHLDETDAIVFRYLKRWKRNSSSLLDMI